MTVQESDLVAIERISQSLLTLRGQRVLLDSDLAELYGVSTKRFNEQFRRNLARFPADFAFQLTENEAESLRSQFATLKNGRGQHRKYLPFAFTEHGALMAAVILNSARAVEMSVYVVRTFVRLRVMMDSNKELAQKLAELERKVGAHDQAIVDILDAIRALMNPPPPKRRGIGFTADIEGSG